MNSWPIYTCDTAEDLLAVLKDLRARRWISRGQSRTYARLAPSIDRLGLRDRSRKLALEQASIKRFRSAAVHFMPGEKFALEDDFVALAVLRHYGTPTRLLDWTQKPEIAAFFAVREDPGLDGEIWAFDQAKYEVLGKAQWRKWPECTAGGSSDDQKFEAGLTAFAPDPPPWIVLMHYLRDMPRQQAQASCYSLMAQFDVDHAEAFAGLLGDPLLYRRYIVKADAKQPALQRLEGLGVSEAAMFPDSSGAAQYSAGVFPQP